MKSPHPTAIRELRKAAELTQKQAAELIHINLRSYQRYEDGDRNMSPGYWELFNIKIQCKVNQVKARKRICDLKDEDMGADAILAIK